MRRTLIASLVIVETLVFCGIVRCAIDLGTDLARPGLAGRTMHLIARAMETTQHEIAAVQTHFHRRDG